MKRYYFETAAGSPVGGFKETGNNNNKRVKTERKMMKKEKKISTTNLYNNVRLTTSEIIYKSKRNSYTDFCFIQILWETQATIDVCLSIDLQK